MGNNLTYWKQQLCWLELLAFETRSLLSFLTIVLEESFILAIVMQTLQNARSCHPTFMSCGASEHIKGTTDCYASWMAARADKVDQRSDGATGSIRIISLKIVAMDGATVSISMKAHERFENVMEFLELNVLDDKFIDADTGEFIADGMLVTDAGVVIEEQYGPDHYNLKDGDSLSIVFIALPKVALSFEEVTHFFLEAQTSNMTLSFLHAEARSLLEICTSRLHNLQLKDHEIPIQHAWPTWKEYVCMHEEREIIIGPGIVQVTARTFREESDPNRHGQPRVDLVFYHADTGYVRLHPGRTRKKDATPIHVSGPHCNGCDAAVELRARRRTVEPDDTKTCTDDL